jgi:hypothetical protein
MKMLDSKDRSCLNGYVQTNAAVICLNLLPLESTLWLHVHMTTYPSLPARPRVVVVTSVAALGSPTSSIDCQHRDNSDLFP